MKKELEEKALWLQRMFRHLPTGLCFFDTELRYRYINEWLATINGLSVDDHLGRRITEVLPDVGCGSRVSAPLRDRNRGIGRGRERTCGDPG